MGGQIANVRIGEWMRSSGSGRLAVMLLHSATDHGRPDSLIERMAGSGRYRPVRRLLRKRERHDAERDEGRASDPCQAVTLAKQVSAKQRGK